MKKNARDLKKLTLDRETLRMLDQPELLKPVGGLPVPPRTYTTCGTFLCHSDTC